MKKILLNEESVLTMTKLYDIDNLSKKLFSTRKTFPSFSVVKLANTRPDICDWLCPVARDRVTTPQQFLTGAPRGQVGWAPGSLRAQKAVQIQ